MECQICGHQCPIQEGGTGRCRMYTCLSGEIVERLPNRYLSIWPGQIETVPFLHFTPGGRYLLLSTLGCNLSCPGCVSHILVRYPDLVSEALSHASPDEILDRIREQSCLGVVFCLNEPTVSLQTVLTTSEKLKEAGYSVGCASNGCMSPQVLDRFLECMDFMNIGMKGSSSAIYQECQAPCGVEQVFHTIQRVHAAGVHLEVSVVYQRGREDEVYGVAEFLSRTSSDIPLHIMRFIPLGGADAYLEPTPDEAEILLSTCKGLLHWVYLFNTPGTGGLNTFCPDCGKILIERSFYGPMGARLTHKARQCRCTCGREVPISGSFSPHHGCEPRYRGGYRTSVILGSVATTLNHLGVRDDKAIKKVFLQVLSGHWLEDMQEYFSTPEGYIAFLRKIAMLAEVEDRVQPLISYYTRILWEVRAFISQIPRPGVYCALSHPLLPSYHDKMEVALAQCAGGEVLNYQIPYTESRADTFTREQFLALHPEVIICSGIGEVHIETFLAHCREEDLTAPALERGKVFCIPEKYAPSGLTFILALLYLVQVLHPDRQFFDLGNEEVMLKKLLSDLLVKPD